MKDIVLIKKLGINGEGIGYIHNKICFIKGALPTEEVEMTVDKHERKYYVGHASRIIQKASSRVKPACIEFERCDGCALLHMNYQDQLNYKRELIKESLLKYTHYLLRRTEIMPVIETNNHHYRQYISCPISFLKGKISIGIYQRESKYFTCMRNCYLVDEDILKTIKDVENIFNQNKCKTYNDKTKEGLRFIMIKKIGDGLSVVLICGQDGLDTKVSQAISQLSLVKSLYYSINTSKHQEFEKQGYKRIYGQDLENEYGLFQVKADIPLSLDTFKHRIHIIQKHISVKDDVLSLYCSSGILEQYIHGHITAIDTHRYNIEQANKNNDNHVNYIYGDVDKRITSLCKKHHYTTLIINVEDHQFTDNIIKSIQISKINKIIVIGDNPYKVSKNISQIEKDYHLQKVYGIDIPHTAQVETIVVLKHK